MKNKGFTLIELLAVLIILALIINIAVPNLLKMVNKNKSDEGATIEELLKYNLELYNSEKKEDLWNDDKSCITVPIFDLISFNPSIDMGECVFTDNDSLVVEKIINDYSYYVDITCGKNIDKNTYVLGEYKEKDIFYRTSSRKRCN